MTACRRCGSALPAGSHHRVRYCSAACRSDATRERKRASWARTHAPAPDRHRGDARPRPVSVDSEPDRYTDEERGVLAAVDRVRRRKGWRFVAVTELLAVLKEMGYEKRER